MLITDSATIEAASWRLAAALCARAPGRLTVTETHPGGGLYDCLSLFARRNDCGHGDGTQNALGHINRCGSFHAVARLDGSKTRLETPLELWSAENEADGWASALKTIAEALGIGATSSQPRAGTMPDAEDASYRYIAEFVSTSAITAAGRWEACNGMFDTSGWGGGVVDLFDKFPAAKRRLGIALPSDVDRQPAYRFWFLLRDGQAQACLEAASGLLWRRDGATQISHCTASSVEESLRDFFQVNPPGE